MDGCRSLRSARAHLDRGQNLRRAGTASKTAPPRPRQIKTIRTNQTGCLKSCAFSMAAHVNLEAEQPGQSRNCESSCIAAGSFGPVCRCPRRSRFLGPGMMACPSGAVFDPSAAGPRFGARPTGPAILRGDLVDFDIGETSEQCHGHRTDLPVALQARSLCALPPRGGSLSRSQIARAVAKVHSYPPDVRHGPRAANHY
jgi:hypothetical protein